MPLLDFNSLVVCNSFHRAEDLKETLDFFHSIGIRKFIVLQDIDPAFYSEWHISNQLNNFKAHIRSIKPRGTVVITAANIRLTPRVTQHPILKELTLKDSEKLFIQPPPFVGNEWLQPDLNYLLYKQKLKPIFTCFEQTYISCKPNVVNGLYKIQPASFCLDLDFIISPQRDSFISQSIRDNKIILPSISRAVWEYYPMVSRFQYYRDRIGKEAYLQFCKYINQSISSIFLHL